MKLELITNKTVEQFLKGINAGADAPSILLNLTFLQIPYCQSDIERRMKLFELLSIYVQESYLLCRKKESMAEHIPVLRIEAQSQLRDDFGSGDIRLESTSALYYRYFSQFEFAIDDLARNANVVPQQFRRRLNSGLSILVTKIRNLEMDANSAAHKKDLHVPLADYSTLIGVDTLLEKLRGIVSKLSSGQIVSVEGMGGIGKTALVHAFVGQDRNRQEYFKILWISARQSVSGLVHTEAIADAANFTLEDVATRLAQQLELDYLVDKPLEDRLKGIQAATALQKYLLVIDNLETIEDYIQLVPALARYGNHFKIIITTRKSLREFAYVTVFPVPELPKSSVSRLLETEAKRRGKQISIMDNELDDLVETIGGLPLAIKLIATQVHIFSVKEILKEFTHAGNGVESFYRYLYWKIWNSLSESSRRLLFTFLSLNPEGEDTEYTALMSGLEPSIFSLAFNELDNYSLIETNSLQSVPKFRIHRLTATFLQTDILKVWDSESNAT